VLAEVELAALAAGLRGRLAAHTVYECHECGTRRLGPRGCSGCRRLRDRLGLGGRCPECDHLVLVAELLMEDER
jgi:DNA-directed RNA polymerase subunit RPC12/RpoP